MNKTPIANRIHIGLFGLCNAGKSSLLNAITGQSVAIVTANKGTTTDPVFKTMELLPLGPVVFMDTPGLDDDSLIGEQRIKKTHEILRKTEIALLVTTPKTELSIQEKEIIQAFEMQNIPYLIVENKIDETKAMLPIAHHKVSALVGTGIEELKEKIGVMIPARKEPPLISDLVEENEMVVLVTPIDTSAPKGRLILPQQQVIRDLLDHHSGAMVVQPSQLPHLLNALKEPPKLVVTDSKAFGEVAGMIPKESKLTSFSILFARYKGILKDTVIGVSAVSKLQNGSKVLVSEGCTHHRQCEDIGTQKIPKGLLHYTGKELEFAFTSGGEFPSDLAGYALVVHCGGCTLNQREIGSRMEMAKAQNIPMTNYGVLLSLLQGTLVQSIELFSDIKEDYLAKIEL